MQTLLKSISAMLEKNVGAYDLITRNRNCSAGIAEVKRPRHR